MEFQLPVQAYVHKNIPKNKFYVHRTVNTKLKREFTDLVQKITWEYKLAPDTIGISGTQAVEEIQIFKIDLKEKVVPKNVLKVIDKNIPYPILYQLTYNDDHLYGISLKAAGEERWYYSDWNRPIAFRFLAPNLERVFQQIITVFITSEQSAGSDFTELITADKERQRLEKEIGAIKNKLRSERQFNKKVELNNILRAKQAELEKLIV